MRGIIIPLLLSLCVCACAARQEPSAPACDEMYVILPGNFIIDLAAGDRPMLNPAAHDFALFCSPAAARDALAKAKPEGDWRVYVLDGASADLARPYGNGEYMLARPAEVRDWVEIRP